MANTVGLYELGAVLGTGDFDCRIRKCKHVITGGEFAVKIYSKEVLSESQWMWDQLAEAVQVMRSLPKYEHVVEMVECFETETHLYILMPYVRSLSLYHWSHQANAASAPMEKKRQIFEQVIRGVHHMHKNRVAHLGIAPDHILLGDSDVKISFLVACKNVVVRDGIAERITHTCGTTHTVAPEVLRHKPYDPFAADVWSCGVVLFFLLNNGKYPFDGANTTKHILRDERRPCDPSLPAEARDLVDRMLDKNPETRITIKDVLAHSWMLKATKALHAEVSWANETKTQLKIKLPTVSMGEREVAAMIIQGVWRFLRKREPKAAAERVAELDNTFPADATILLSSTPTDDEPSTAIRLAHDKWKNNLKWAPVKCTSCGNPPPQRVRPGLAPYPQAAVKPALGQRN
jgi:serine/threonine protein kinase